MSELRFRRYRAADAEAVWTLHERAMADAGTDPSDIPGTDDLRSVETDYIEAGGEFLVGVGDTGTGEGAGTEGLETTDGTVVAMGGYVPTTDGRADERAVAGRSVAELHRMRVAPARQREGHGRALLAALEDRASAAGFERLLATTAARQTAAVRFYPAAGYEPAGSSTHGEYELRHFEKELAPARADQG